VQIFHRGWDQHGNAAARPRLQCKDVDQACYGLVQDLKQRGLLEDTLVIWGGEFGRTVYCQGTLTETDYGRDHHPRCFSIWMAGGGIKPGMVYGETDEMSYNIVKDPVHVRDLHATILHLLGIDHERLSFKFQGTSTSAGLSDPRSSCSRWPGNTERFRGRSRHGRILATMPRSIIQTSLAFATGGVLSFHSVE
jgi:arylsulfatase A-like enzyme